MTNFSDQDQIQVSNRLLSAIGGVDGYWEYYLYLKGEHLLESDFRIWQKMETQLGKHKATRYNTFESFSSAKSRWIKSNRKHLNHLFL